MDADLDHYLCRTTSFCACMRWMSFRTLLERHLDAIHSEIELEPLARPNQGNQHTMLILYCSSTSSNCHYGFCAHTRIVPVEVFELLEVVDRSGRLGVRYSNVNHRESFNADRVIFPLITQDATPPRQTNAEGNRFCGEEEHGVGRVLVGQRQGRCVGLTRLGEHTRRDHTDDLDGPSHTQVLAFVGDFRLAKLRTITPLDKRHEGVLWIWLVQVEIRRLSLGACGKGGTSDDTTDCRSFPDMLPG